MVVIFKQRWLVWAVDDTVMFVAFINEIVNDAVKMYGKRFFNIDDEMYMVGHQLPCRSADLWIRPFDMGDLSADFPSNWR